MASSRSAGRYQTVAAIGICLLLLWLAYDHLSPEAAPYSAQADPHADLEVMSKQARATNRHLMLVFGANWCPDCRRLDKAMNREDIAELLARHFTIVKVDIGNWDRNMDFAEQWGNPVAGGIPAIVIATSEQEALYSTTAGELATARHMSGDELRGHFAAFAAIATQAH